MKKTITFFICAIFILSASAAYAAPVGNIATPSVLKKGLVFQGQESQYGVVAGPEIDFTWDRKLKNQEDDTEYSFYGGKVGVLLMDRFIAYAVLGAAEGRKQKFDISGTKIKWETDYGFAWAIGGTAMLYETKLEQLGNGTLRFGIDGRYRQSHLDVDTVVRNDVSYKTSSADVTESKFELEEWQVAAAVAYQIEQFIPYLGVKYSDTSGEATATIGGSSYKNDFEADDNVGFFVGGDFLVNDSFTVNVEGRFIDETALSASATLRF